MKFLLVSPFTNASGSSIRFWNIALQLHKQGHSVVLVERKGDKLKKPIFFSDSITYYASPSTGNLIGDILLSFIFNLFIFARHYDCNVFYALKPAPNNCIPAIIAGIFGKKILLDIDDLDYAYWPQSLKRSFYKFSFDFFSRQFPLITYHTPNLKKYLIDTLNINESKTYYLAQGVSDNFLDVNIKNSKKTKSIIYVATLSITSDFDKLIPMLTNICKIHSDVQISIVGDGIRRSDFELLVKKHKIEKNVTFTGIIPHSELAQFICQHQIGLNYMEHSEVNDCRAILKIREYLACGLQVICNDCGDVELFKDYIFIEKSIEQIQKQLINLLKDTIKINNDGISFVKSDYTWKTIIASFLHNCNLLSFSENRRQ